MPLSPEDASGARTAAAEHTDRMLQFPNVFGCAVGERTVGGRATGETSLVVFVERKLPLESLRSDEILPREVQTQSGTVVVDVVEPAVPRLGVDNAAYRPLRGGCQLAAVANEVREPSAPSCTTVPTRKWCCSPATTCSPRRSARLHADEHAGAPTGGFRDRRHQAHHSVVQSAARRLRANLQAHVDVGIVSLDATIDAQFRVIDLGKHPYVPLPPFEGLEVNKRGFVTEVTTGTIKETDLTVVITDFNGQTVRLGGVGSGFSVQSPKDGLFFQRGDSGRSWSTRTAVRPAG